MATNKTFGTQYDDTILVTANSSTVTTSGTAKNKKAATETFDGSDFGNAIFAGDGKDVVYGVGSASDAVDGGNGDDLIYGGAGNDLLAGGVGKDVIYGGSGNDIIGSVRPGTSSGMTTDYVIVQSGDQIGDTLIGDGFDPVTSGISVTLALVAQAGDDVIAGGNGKDVIWGDNGPNSGGGANTSVGGNDQIFSGNGDDTVYGQGGNDLIQGQNGNDLIDAGAGDDNIEGGMGVDQVKGGAGRDLFIYNSSLESTAAAMDIIIDFSRADSDKIDLRPLLGTTDLEWGGNAAKAFGVWQEASGPNTLVRVDTTGDSLADMVIRLNGSFNLKNADFLGVKNAPPTLETPSGIVYNESPNDDSFDSAFGTLSGSDTDFNDVVSFEIADSSTSDLPEYDVSASSAYGTLYLNSTSGDYQFIADDAAIEALKESTSIDFAVNATDGSADSPSQNLTITLNGVNDIPVLDPVSNATLNDTSGDDTFGDITDSLSGSDRDNDDVAFELDGSGSSDLEDYDASKSSDYGTFYLNTSTGAYRFIANDAAIEALKTTTSVSFAVNATDGSADSTPQDLTITFNGVNDTPVLNPVSNATLNDTDGNDTFTDITGTLSGSDRDNDSVTFELGSSSSSALAGYNVQRSSSYGTFYLNTSTGAYRFIANDAAIEALKTSTSVAFAVNATDGSADSTPQNLTITLNGVNDAPVRYVGASDVVTGSVTELASNNANANSGSYMHQVSGSFQVQDVDIGDALIKQSIVQSAPNNAFYGSLVVDSVGVAVNGIRTVNWTYSVSDLALNPLAAGSGPTQTFAITLSDNTATMTQNVSIALTGAADGPAFGGDVVKTVNEFFDGNFLENFGIHTITGTVTATNMPAGSLSVQQVGFPGSFALGSFSATASAIDANGNATISWSYTVADCLLDVLNGSGQSDGVQLQITHSANPLITQSVSIALTGALDNPMSPEVSFFDAPNNNAEYATSDDPGFPGDFQVYGLDGDDELTAGSNARQVLFGGEGSDIFKLDAGLVLGVGGSGNDRFDFNDAFEVWAWGQQGLDYFNIVNASPGARLWAMDFTLGEDHIVTFATADNYTLTLGHTSATNQSDEGYNPYVADGTPYYLLTGPSETYSTIDFHIIGSTLPNLNPAQIIA